MTIAVWSTIEVRPFHVEFAQEDIDGLRRRVQAFMSLRQEGSAS